MGDSVKRYLQIKSECYYIIIIHIKVFYNSKNKFIQNFLDIFLISVYNSKRYKKCSDNKNDIEKRGNLLELAKIVLDQVIVMFLLIAVGYTANKIKIINKDTNAQLTTFLLYVVTSSVIVNAFQTPFEIEKLKLLGLALLLAIISHVVSIFISIIFVRKKNNENCGIERFAMIYTNCGFMALPLLDATFGKDGVLFGSVYMVVFQILSWTHGYIGISGKFSKGQIMKTFLSPTIIAVVVGISLFILNVKLPFTIGKTIEYVGSLNTPLAMVVIGVNLAQSRMIDAFKTFRNYYVVMFINFIIPIVIVLLFSMTKIFPTNLIMINIISVACPCAATTVMFSQRLGKDYIYAGHILTLSNIASIVSIPIVVIIAQSLIK